jgi:3-hydroxybutyryl-CoA dehydrogenase
VIEAIVEELEPKRELFAELDRITRPDAVLATNTSALSVSDIAEATEHPERVVGMHFFNPAPVLPLVEIVRHAVRATTPSGPPTSGPSRRASGPVTATTRLGSSSTASSFRCSTIASVSSTNRASRPRISTRR